MKLEFVARVALSVALFLAGLSPAGAQPASALEPGVRASDAARLPVLAKDPTAGHLRPGEQVLVDDGSCPAAQIKEVTGGTNRKCPANSDVLDTTQCHSTTGTRRTSRCIVRP